LAAFGIGSLLSTVVAARVAGRRYQARAIGTAVASIAVLSLILAGVLTPIAVVVILPLIGMSQGLADVLSDVLLHRSVPPDRLAGVYALLEFSSGAGLIVGSLIAQVAIAASGPRLALVGIGVFLLAVVAVSIGGLRAADTTANVPVVEMSLLRRVPLFAPLPETALEDVARSAVEVDVLAATPLIVAGESGDRFFVVADGSFAVTIDGQQVATVERGGSFGEIALLADVARTASVTAREPSSVLAIERRPFLVAVTGHDSSRQAAWGVMRALRGDDLPIAGPDDFADGGEP
jgi:MFS family permease